MDSPICTKDYHIYPISTLPRILLGYKINNKFDESRIKIKSKYNPQRISHFSRLRHELEPVFFYGVEIKPKKMYSELLDCICRLAANTPHITSQGYMNMLKSHNLSCDECYSYLSDSVYPIDIKYLNNISRKNYTKELDAGFNNMLEETDHPWYAALPNFKIFILARSAGYHMDYNLT